MDNKFHFMGNLLHQKCPTILIQPFFLLSIFLFSLFESSQSLFWASFGMVGLENFELLGIKTYTRFWGLLMFGSYCVINVIVLLNLLIAMVGIVIKASLRNFHIEFRNGKLSDVEFLCYD